MRRASIRSSSFSPRDATTIRSELQDWGPGKFDAHYILDGRSAPVLIPARVRAGRPGWNMHRFEEIGIDQEHASRGPEDEYYRTTPLQGLWTHAEGGFYHDGRFATLADVVDHYDGFLNLGLSAGEKTDLIEYLKSL